MPMVHEWENLKAEKEDVVALPKQSCSGIEVSRIRGGKEQRDWDIEEASWGDWCHTSMSFQSQQVVGYSFLDFCWMCLLILG